MGRIDKRRQKKKRVLRKTFLLVLVIFLCLLGTGLYIGFKSYHAANKSYNDLGREKSDLRTEKVTIADDPVSVLLLGVEDYSSGGKNGRTDTIMVATFNPNDEKLQLLSIPRDTLVDIAGRDERDKINHAHAFGGKEMTIETVEKFLEIPIDYYALVNFNAFKNVVDTLGGITVDVPFDFVQYSDDEKPIRYEFHEGEMKVNGSQALAYARMRSKDPLGDIGRNQRQQEVIKSIIDKAFSFGTITKITDLAEDFGSNVETNIKVSDGISFYKEYSNFGVNSIESLVLETYPEKINGISYQIADTESLDQVKSKLKEHLEINSNINNKVENDN